MRRWIYAATTALSLAGFGALAPAQALPVQPGIPAPTDVQQTQFWFGGRNFCFYPNGWNGPGFYWCGYAWRRGFGWGGGHGWNGWDHRRPPHWHGGGRPPHWGGGGRPPPHARPPGGRPPHAGRPGGGGGRPGGPGGGHGGHRR